MKLKKLSQRKTLKKTCTPGLGFLKKVLEIVCAHFSLCYYKIAVQMFSVTSGLCIFKIPSCLFWLLYSFLEGIRDKRLMLYLRFRCQKARKVEAASDNKLQRKVNDKVAFHLG